ncbi:MAG: radical SAM protein [bacterium]
MQRSKREGAGEDGRLGLSAVLVYPNTRDVALASLGYLKVRDLLSRRLQLVDISYLPGPDEPVVSPKQGLLLGEATGHEVSKFDIVAFSISYENDYVHVAELLLKAGIPPLAADRGDESAPRGGDRVAGFPLVVFGGFAMSLNPLPVADLADVVVAGEFEAVADRLLETIAEFRPGCTARHETPAGMGTPARTGLLKRLAEIEGIYVPSLGEHPVKRVWCEVGAIADLGSSSEPTGDTGSGETGAPRGGSSRAEFYRRDAAVTGQGSHFGDMFLVETGRGCGRGCLFCAAGNIYRPVRMRDAQSILGSAGPSRRLGLVGTAVGDHPDLIQLIDSLLSKGRTAGISSLRADQVTPELVERLVKCGIKTITIAPEAGTDGLRQRIGKRITDEQVVEAVRILSEAGVANIKLYFMIGLPGETDEDVEAIVTLVARLEKMRGKSRLGVSAGAFVPKPHTAFQWAAFASRETLRRRFKLLRPIRGLKGCTLKMNSIDGAWTEAVLARGDRSLSAALIDSARSGQPLKTILRKRGFDASRELDTETPLPWDFLDCGVGGEGLLKQYRRALQA